MNAQTDLIFCWAHISEGTFSDFAAHLIDIENFTTKKEKKYINNSDIFHIPAQNIDFGYLLEPPRRGGSIEYPKPMILKQKKKKKKKKKEN